LNNVQLIRTSIIRHNALVFFLSFSVLFSCFIVVRLKVYTHTRSTCIEDNAIRFKLYFSLSFSVCFSIGLSPNRIEDDDDRGRACSSSSILCFRSILHSFDQREEEKKLMVIIIIIVIFLMYFLTSLSNELISIIDIIVVEVRLVLTMNDIHS
jgi:hypothetical protein